MDFSILLEGDSLTLTERRTLSKDFTFYDYVYSIRNAVLDVDYLAVEKIILKLYEGGEEVYDYDDPESMMELKKKFILEGESYFYSLLQDKLESPKGYQEIIKHHKRVSERDGDNPYLFLCNFTDSKGKHILSKMLRCDNIDLLVSSGIIKPITQLSHFRIHEKGVDVVKVRFEYTAPYKIHFIVYIKNYEYYYGVIDMENV